MLARLGALGDLPARSLPVGQVVVIVNGREMGRLAVGRPTRLVRRPGLLVSQAEIEAELRRSLVELGGQTNEANVQWGCEVVDLDEDPCGVTVRLADGETLRTGRAGAPLLDSYEAERDRVFVPLLNRPWVQRRIWDQASQLTLSYRGGPLAAARRWSPAWRPGDRVPDLSCRRQDRSCSRLHAELSPRWGLLAAPSPTAQGCLQVACDCLGCDRVVPLIPEGRPGRTVLLVRPDAHLAWRGSTSDGLRRWLSDALDGGPAKDAAARPVVVSGWDA